MATLTGRQVNNTFKGLLHIDNSNAGVDGTYRDIEDGEGTASGLQLSTAGPKVPSGKTLTIAGTVDVSSASWTGKVPVANGGTNAASAGSGRTNLGLGTADTPQFTALNLGGTDATLARSGAGDLTIEGNAIYRAGGTNVAVADGGTAANTAGSARTNLGLGDAATKTVGVANGNVPAMDATGYPAANGSQITALNATNLASGTVASARLPKASAAQMAAETADVYPDASLVKFSPGVVKFAAYVTVSGGTPTLAANINVSGITDSGPGLLTLTINNDMANANYYVIVTCVGADGSVRTGMESSTTARTAGSVKVACIDKDGTQQDPAAWNIVGFGTLA